MAVTPVPIPSDCEDGFLGAFWRRPHSYLDSTVQAGIPAFMLMRDEDRRRGDRLLGQELSPAWNGIDSSATFYSMMSLTLATER